MSFEDDTALAPAGEGSWEGEIADGWDTPRGPLGGYVMAILMRGFELAVDDAERQARSLTMHFLRVPEAGPVTVEAQVERTGRSLTSVSGRLFQGDKVVGIALGAYSKAWPGPLLEDAPMPEVEPPDPPQPGRALPDAPSPTFVQRMVFQHRFGERPFSRAEEGLTGGWLGLYEDGEPIDALRMAVLADAWFPSPWPRLSELAPAPTLDLTIHFRAPLPVDAPLLLGRFDTKLVRDGFFDENGELWAPDGTLVAQSRQLGLLLDAKT